jgi:diguanylate cyclase
MKNKTIFLTFGIFIGIGLIYLFYSGENQILIRNLAYIFAPLTALISALLAAREYGLKNKHGKALLLIFAGITLWFIGEFLWLIFEHILHIEPFPSVADGFFLFGYPLLYIGLLLEYRSGKVKLSTPKLLLNGTLAAIFGALILFFGILPAYSIENSVLENIFSIAYSLGNLVLAITMIMILSLILEYKQGKIFYPWFFFFIGILTTITADLLFGVYFNEYLDGSIYHRNILDLLWTSGYLFFSLSFFKFINIVREAREKIANAGQ